MRAWLREHLGTAAAIENLQGESDVMKRVRESSGSIGTRANTDQQPQKQSAGVKAYAQLPITSSSKTATLPGDSKPAGTMALPSKSPGRVQSSLQTNNVQNALPNPTSTRARRPQRKSATVAGNTAARLITTGISRTKCKHAAGNSSLLCSAVQHMPDTGHVVEEISLSPDDDHVEAKIQAGTASVQQDIDPIPMKEALSQLTGQPSTSSMMQTDAQQRAAGSNILQTFLPSSAGSNKTNVIEQIVLDMGSPRDAYVPAAEPSSAICHIQSNAEEGTVSGFNKHESDGNQTAVGQSSATSGGVGNAHANICLANYSWNVAQQAQMPLPDAAVDNTGDLLQPCEGPGCVDGISVADQQPGSPASMLTSSLTQKLADVQLLSQMNSNSAMPCSPAVANDLVLQQSMHMSQSQVQSSCVVCSGSHETSPSLSNKQQPAGRPARRSPGRPMPTNTHPDQVLARPSSPPAIHPPLHQSSNNHVIHNANDTSQQAEGHQQSNITNSGPRSFPASPVPRRKLSQKHTGQQRATASQQNVIEHEAGGHRPVRPSSPSGVCNGSAQVTSDMVHDTNRQPDNVYQPGRHASLQNSPRSRSPSKRRDSRGVEARRQSSAEFECVDGASVVEVPNQETLHDVIPEDHPILDHPAMVPVPLNNKQHTRVFTVDLSSRPATHNGQQASGVAVGASSLAADGYGQGTPSDLRSKAHNSLEVLARLKHVRSMQQAPQHTQHSIHAHPVQQGYANIQGPLEVHAQGPHEQACQHNVGMHNNSSNNPNDHYNDLSWNQHDQQPWQQLHSSAWPTTSYTQEGYWENIPTQVWDGMGNNHDAGNDRQMMHHGNMSHQGYEVHNHNYHQPWQANHQPHAQHTGWMDNHHHNTHQVEAPYQQHLGRHNHSSNQAPMNGSGQQVGPYDHDHHHQQQLYPPPSEWHSMHSMQQQPWQGPASDLPDDNSHATAQPELSMQYWQNSNLYNMLWLHETMPFQQNALEFAAWCCRVDSAAVQELMKQKRGMGDFKVRWDFMKQFMDSVLHPDLYMPASNTILWPVAPPPQQPAAATGQEAIPAGNGLPCSRHDHGLQAGFHAEMQLHQPMQPPQQAQQHVANNGHASWQQQHQMQDVKRWWPGVRESLRVLCEEFTSPGRGAYTRRFIVTSYQEIWRRMLRKDAAERHYYEIITADRPCHMYFDIEFSRSANPGVHGPALVDKVVKAVKQLFKDDWDIELDDMCFLELESRVGLSPATTTRPTANQQQLRNNDLHNQQPVEDSDEIAVSEAKLVLSQVRMEQLTQQVPHLSQSNTQANSQSQAAHSQAVNAHASETLWQQAASQQPGREAALDPSLALAARELDQPDKFSVHLIVRAPGGWVFPNNLAVGAAVGSLRRYASLWSELQVAKTLNPEDGITSAVDLAVYSRTRNFRCVWCCKGGKEAVLRPTSRYMGALRVPTTEQPRVPEGRINERTAHGMATSLTNEEIFLASLICNVPEGARMLDCDHLAPLTRAAMVSSNAGQRCGTGPTRRQGSPGEPTTDNMISHPRFDRPVKLTWTLPQVDQAVNQYRAALQQVALQAIPFVEAAAMHRAAGQAAYVRSISYNGEASKVAFGLLGPGSHWCERVGRQHRSNHIYLVLDWESSTWTQKCFDPDCAGWHSDYQPLPADVAQQGVLETLRPPPPLPPAPQ